MGRFQDGTPVALHDAAGWPGDHNDFNFFDNDRDGQKCPYHAHIRKVNARDDTANSRQRQIVRRGITYGERVKEPKDDPSPAEMPTGGVGLLFMCYQKDIKKQFEFLYFRQANNVNFVREKTGIDPVIGQMQKAQPQQQWPVAWGAPQSEQQPCSFGGFVTPRGAEYLFAPSISFLKKL
jgi:deferrochelatase/peroxidase EfeB